ncbi:hypothetical protein [Oceanicella sp. SM1341]|nr:hypothetical protein [Oceanicella sp. SM1341]
MARILKYLLYLVVLGLAALAVYALFADLPAPVEEITIDVPLPADG